MAAAGASHAAPQAAKLPPPDLISRLTTQDEYRIGPLDELEISVFQVADLDRTVQVDASGKINLPLIGGVIAGGKTSKELSDHIAAQLGAKYLQNPQVTVSVKNAQSQRVTVEGAVGQPGVYPIQGRTTLLQAVALARGPDARTARLDKVVVFRTVEGQRMAAQFDLKAIRKGKAEDPQVFGDDIIVVDSSGSKTFLSSIIGATPLLRIFIPY